jgi:hypothetical protein
VSSVSPDALSIDCLTPDSGTAGSFFVKSAVVLLSPFLLVVVIGFFWFARWYIRSAFCPTSDGARHKQSKRKAADKSLKSRSVEALPVAVPALAMHNPMAIKGRKTPRSAESAGRLRRLLARIDEEDFRKAIFAAASRKQGKPFQPTKKVSILTVIRAAQANMRKSATWEHTRDRMIVSIFVVLFMIHTTVTRAALKLFTCRNIIDLSGRGESARRAVLAADMTLGCSAPSSVAWQLAAGVPTFVLFSCGIPLISYLALRRNRHRLSDRRIKQVYGFLFAGFNDEVYFWESVIMMRKVGLSVVAVFLEPVGIDIQAYVALGILFGASVLHAAYWPYELASVNYLEMFSLVASFVTICMGLFTLSPNSTESVQIFATAGIFTAQILFFVAAFVLLVSTTCASIKRDESASIITTVSRSLRRVSSFAGRLGSERKLAASNSPTIAGAPDTKGSPEAVGSLPSLRNLASTSSPPTRPFAPRPPPSRERLSHRPSMVRTDNIIEMAKLPLTPMTPSIGKDMSKNPLLTPKS